MSVRIYPGHCLQRMAELPAAQSPERTLDSALQVKHQTPYPGSVGQPLQHGAEAEQGDIPDLSTADAARLDLIEGQRLQEVGDV